MKHNKFCQSCSMPLSAELLGSEPDGSKSSDYCKFCYENGEFTHPRYSLDEMISHLQDQMDGQNLPEDIIESAIARLPHLKRWEKGVFSKANDHPMVIIILGLPGSGKTYFAKALSKTLRATYINSDSIRETFPGPNRYSRTDKNIVYDMMLKKMLIAMHEGKTVIMDATFYKNDIRRRFTSYVREQGVLHFIEIVADELVIKNRLSARQNSHADFGVYQLVKKEWDPIDFRHLTIKSTDNNIDEMISQAIDYLEPVSTK